MLDEKVKSKLNCRRSTLDTAPDDRISSGIALDYRKDMSAQNLMTWISSSLSRHSRYTQGVADLLEESVPNQARTQARFTRSEICGRRLNLDFNFGGVLWPQAIASLCTSRFPTTQRYKPSTMLHSFRTSTTLQIISTINTQGIISEV